MVMTKLNLPSLYTVLQWKLPVFSLCYFRLLYFQGLLFPYRLKHSSFKPVSKINQATLETLVSEIFLYS